MPGIVCTASRVRGWIVLGAFALGLTIGCARTPAEPVLESTRGFLRDGAAARIDAAYARMGEAYQRRCDRDCFAREVDKARPELQRALEDVQNGKARVELAAQLTLTDGTALALAQAPPKETPAAPGAKSTAAKDAPGAGTFQLTNNPLEFYPQSSPEQALRSFIRAVRARRYDVLLRFVPAVLREQMTREQLTARFEGTKRPEIERQLTAAEKHLAEPFIYEGTTARLPVGDGREARLVSEDGRWCVAQVE